MVLSLQTQRQLTRHCCLTGTIQTCHQDDRWTTRQVQFCGLTAHQFCQFVVYDLDHHLTRLHGCEHVLTQRLLLYRVCESLSNLIVHIGLQKCLAHVLQRFRYIDFGDFTFTLQYFERPFQSLA